MTEKEINRLKLMKNLHSEDLWKEARKYYCDKCHYYPGWREVGKCQHTINPDKEIMISSMVPIWTCFEKRR